MEENQHQKPLDSAEYTTYFECSVDQDKFAPAFRKAQAAMGQALKDADNPFFKSKYADHAEIVKVCKGPLNDHGISYSQWLMMPQNAAPWQVPEGVMNFLTTHYAILPDEDKADLLPWILGTRPKPRIAVMTRLQHESGQYQACMAAMPCIKEDPQAYLATASYLRRGCLQAALGIPSVDDDGEEASGRKHDPASYSKEMVKDFPPNTWVTGTFKKMNLAQKAGDPDTVVIDVQGMGMKLEVQALELKARFKEPGSPVTFKYTKRGSFKVLSELKNIVSAPHPVPLSEVKNMGLMSPGGEGEPTAIEPTDLDGYIEAVLVGFQQKKAMVLGKQTAVTDLEFEDKEGKFTARSYNDIGYYGFSEWGELIDRKVLVKMRTSEKGYHTVDDIQ